MTSFVTSGLLISHLRRLAQNKIINIKIPINHYNKQQKAVAFVEFGDKEAMDDALAKRHEVSTVIEANVRMHLSSLASYQKSLGDANPKVAVALDSDGGQRGTVRGSGRGGRGVFGRGSFGGNTRGRVDGGEGGKKGDSK